MSFITVYKLEREFDRNDHWEEVPVGTFATGVNAVEEFLRSLNPGDQSVAVISFGRVAYRVRPTQVCECCRQELQG